MDLPAALRDAIEAEAASVPGPRLGARAAALSRAYRDSGQPGRGAVDGEAALAYAAYRLPATFAAVDAALGQLQEARPGWQPAAVLDAGAGPGSGLWAASLRWPSICHARALEREPAMLALGRRLGGAALSPAVRAAAWQRADLRQPLGTGVADLVLITYVLGELKADEQSPLVERLFRATRDVLVVVEPGTPAGFGRVREARAQLIGLGGHVLAPCPHADACPMADADWCHFAARLGRSRLHRQAKRATQSYEDEKFSFVAVGRTAGARARARVLRHPQVHGGHVRLRLCAPGGVTDHTVARSAGERYRQARRLAWGSALRRSDDGEP